MQTGLIHELLCIPPGHVQAAVIIVWSRARCAILCEAVGCSLQVMVPCNLVGVSKRFGGTYPVLLQDTLHSCVLVLVDKVVTPDSGRYVAPHIVFRDLF